MAVLSDPDLGRLYTGTRERLSDLVLGLGEAELAAPVPACPGWSVLDVVYHLLAVAEDIAAGRLTRPPDDAQTAAQVARHRGTPVQPAVQAWDRLAGPLAELISRAGVWPAVFDVASHEQDIRGALGRPGARGSEVVRTSAARLVALMQPSVPVRVVCEAFECRVGPEETQCPELVLRTTRFEAFRWRLGRRSLGQVRSYDWSADPTAVLGDLFIFGPSPADIIE